MQEERFKIKYITVKNCFVYLSETRTRRFEPAKINGAKVSHNNKYYYLSWRPISGLDESLGISATFARTLNIKEGDEVTVSSVSDPPFLSSITVTPWDAQDWEIVEYQAEKIQSILLDQINLVAKNQTIVVWVSKGLSITLSIDAINSDFLYGAIGNHTEVHVSQYTSGTQSRRKVFSSSTSETSEESSKFNIWSIFRKISNMTQKTMDHRASQSSDDISSWMDRQSSLTAPQTFRVCSLASIKKFYSSNSFVNHVESPYDAFVHATHFLTNFTGLKDAEGRLFRLRKVREDRQYVNAASTDFLRSIDSAAAKERADLVVRLFAIGRALENHSNDPNCSFESIDSSHRPIYVSMTLMRNLKLRMGGKVLLEAAEPLDRSIASIQVSSSTSSTTRRNFEEFLVETAREKETLLNFPGRIYLKDGTSCSVSTSPECSYSLLNVERLADIDINVGSLDENVLSDAENDAEEIDLSTVSLGPLESTLAESRIILELGLGLGGGRNFRYEPGNLLICGDVGVGKTTFCKVLQREMQKAPHFVHTHFIECKPLKGKKVEATHKIILAAMAECIYHEPSILFLDDLESITSSPSDDEGHTPDAINAARILDVIFNITAEYQSSHCVSLVATCTKMTKIGPKLRSARGVHLFRTVLTLPDLTQEHRIGILRLALENNIRVPEVINWDYYGSKTEGWVAQDLVDFAEKGAFASWKRHGCQGLSVDIVRKFGGFVSLAEQTAEIILAEEDLCETLKRYKTMSLHGVQLYKKSGHDWSNIGGLAKVKEVLVQLLEWPLKHPELYRNSPVKNQNGILLYGMPGTGKTILAGAIAGRCDLNLISIKGPELLSKYIGASEEAVRNIFEKAHRAKPCILFFDEFDSLAPRRGHDSTGVTDRVVNQLLTQLDGVEGREGVAVVAASSRPDLLDPALLRPGRLDKSLLCPLPDENDREDIFIGLCKAQNVETEDLDLKELAKLSSGFTGADINAALTQAKYNALENVLANVSSDQPTCATAIALTQKDIRDSLKATNPSLSTGEKEKYRRIYGQFSKSNIFENIGSIKQRATLA